MQNASKLDLTVWPGPVVEMYLGTKTADQVFASNRSVTGQEQRKRDGEVYFYVAEILLLDKDQQTAKTYLRNAIEKGAVPSTEYFGAKAELARFDE